MNQSEKNFHSSYAKLMTKTSDQLVGITDYMGTSLEVNGYHTMDMYIKYMNNTWTCAMQKIQTYRHKCYFHIGAKHMDVTVEQTMYNLYTTLTMPGT